MCIIWKDKTTFTQITLVLSFTFLFSEHLNRTTQNTRKKHRKFTEESTRVCNKNDLKTSFQGAVILCLFKHWKSSGNWNSKLLNFEKKAFFSFANTLGIISNCRRKLHRFGTTLHDNGRLMTEWKTPPTISSWEERSILNRMNCL